MKKTLYRAFVLFLTASFLFTMASPAFATPAAEDTFLAYAMPADIVTSSLINGIGVLPGDDVQVYEGVVQRCVNYLTDLGRVVDGKIDVWKREQVGDNAWKYGADISLVDVIREWIWGEKVVIPLSSQSLPDGVDDLSDLKYWQEYYKTYPYFLTILKPNSGGYAWTFIASSSPFVVTSDSKYQFIENEDGSKMTSRSSSGSTSSSSRFSTPLTSTFVYGGSGYDETAFSEYDLTLGYIRPGSEIFGDAYPDWYRNIATIPLPGATSPDDDIKALPFAPGQTLGDTLTIPQEDVWTGTGSYVEAPAVPDTVTLSDVLTSILSIPASIVEAIGNLFFPAVDGLTMSLSDFFPFCIPYDLFEFFTLLQAEPEAPKFEWKIPVPQLGRTFEVEVDLSAWDEVAQLFRNLELLAFIVGLAYVTREKFLRS